MAARKKTARKKPARKAARKEAAAQQTGAPKAPAKKAARKAAAKPAKAAAKPAKAATKPAKRKASASKRKPATTPASGGKPGARTTSVRRKRGAAPVADAAAFPEIEALAELMQKHGLHEVSYSREADGSTSLHVSKGGAAMLPTAAPIHAVPAAAPLAAAAAPAEVAAEAAPAAPAETLHAFKSPMVGTFYRAPSPEAAPFSSTGDSVDPSSVVCIIEAMKVMNEINPDAAGEIVSIEVENGEAVEFGQTLMLLRPR